MKTFHLHGKLAEFGGPYALDVATAAEGLRALLIQLPGFRKALEVGEYQVHRGPLVSRPLAAAEELKLPFGARRELHLVPVAAGADKGGTSKLLIGGALIAAALVFAPPVVGALGPTQGLGTAFVSIAGAEITYGSIAALGATIALVGVSQLLSPQPQSGGTNQGIGERENPDQRPSFFFNGPVNVSAEGHPVPIAFGRVEVGSVVISAGINVEQI